jgi:hypothetical protein
MHAPCIVSAVENKKPGRREFKSYGCANQKPSLGRRNVVAYNSKVPPSEGPM